MSSSILPYKGNSSLDAAAIYCPYVPLTISPATPYFHKSSRRYIVGNDKIYLYNYEDDTICEIIEIANSNGFSIDIEENYNNFQNLAWIISNYTEEDLLYLKLKDLL